MMQAHVPTLFLVIITVSFMLSIALACAGYRKKPELMLWSTSFALHGLAFVFYSLRGEVSDLISIVGANVFISSIFAILAEGLFYFLRRQAPRLLIWSPVLLIAVSFSLLLDYLALRIIIGCAVFGFQGLLLLYFVAQHNRLIVGRGKYIFAASAFIESCILVSRALILSQGYTVPTLTVADPLNTITYLCSIVCLILLVISLFLMTWERDEHALRVSEHELKSAVAMAEQQHRELEVTLRTANDGIYIIDENGLLIDANDAFLQMHQFDKSVISQLHVQDWDTQLEDVLLHSYARRVRDSAQKMIFETVHRCRDGRHLNVEVSANALTRNGQQVVYCAARDISDRKLLETQLLAQAHFDYLTGLNNRRYFVELSEGELMRAKRYQKKLSLLMLDLDDFKHVNDTYGHKAGDTVLTQVALICRNVLREIDIIGRLGGEEFAVVLPETDVDYAIEVAERLREVVAQTRISINDNTSLHMTVSIGITSLAPWHDNVDALLLSADKALYLAKGAGKNRVVCA
ncbi:sensor domain-containing diguanylate cyclase [Methylotenera mobilis]|uniref:sensor domain-containing diguanylate cyclase n=1 Tax=Methylotenera mobilis TaxID=359408 RepID=UPI0003613C81|nr:sensor domain-containing diguanylate cyclase [Methylotenera mobilis]PPC96067.1 MAG: sensor domain-containing diguanylate cyclase [Methylotenera sp.]